MAISLKIFKCSRLQLWRALLEALSVALPVQKKVLIPKPPLIGENKQALCLNPMLLNGLSLGTSLFYKWPTNGRVEWGTYDSSTEAVEILAPGVEMHALVTSMLFLLLPLIWLGRQNQFLGSFSRRSSIYLALNGTRQLQTLSYISLLIRIFCLTTFQPLLSNLFELAQYTSGSDDPVLKGGSRLVRSWIWISQREQHQDVASKYKANGHLGRAIEPYA